MIAAASRMDWSRRSTQRRSLADLIEHEGKLCSLEVMIFQPSAINLRGLPERSVDDSQPVHLSLRLRWLVGGSYGSLQTALAGREPGFGQAACDLGFSGADGD